MKANHLFAALLMGTSLIGCASPTSPAAKKPARSDVMDLTDAPAAPITPAKSPASVAPEAAPVESAPTASTPQTGARKHVVAAKDTLYALAKQYYGDGKQYPKILAANPGLVAEHMPVGKAIVIP